MTRIIFGAYSNVIIKPVPKKFRSYITLLPPLPLRYANNPNETYKNLSNIPTIERPKISYKWEQDMYEKDDKDKEYLIMIDWNTNKMYYTTNETEVDEVHISYSLYSKFIANCSKLYNGKIADVFDVGNSGYDKRFISGDKFTVLLETLKYINNKYDIDTLSSNHIFELDEFIDLLTTASDHGGVYILVN